MAKPLLFCSKDKRKGQNIDCISKMGVTTTKLFICFLHFGCPVFLEPQQPHLDESVERSHKLHRCITQLMHPKKTLEHHPTWRFEVLGWSVGKITFRLSKKKIFKAII